MDEYNNMQSNQGYQDNQGGYQSNPNGYQDNFDYNYNNTYNNGGNMSAPQPTMDTSPMSMGDWVLTILASFIPCVGMILYIVWAFSKKGNVNRRNYCRANLIIMAVVMGVYIVFVGIFGAAIVNGM